MPNEHVLNGLIAKRAELAGKVEILQREMRDLVAMLDHVDAAIRLFDPEGAVGRQAQAASTAHGVQG